MPDAANPEDRRWRLVRDLFEAALDLEPERRARFLERECTDPGVRVEVEDLLDLEGRASGQLTGAVAGASAALAGSIGLAAGQQLGPYRILREIGRGGMGVVYLAARSDREFEQQVAIKVCSGLLGQATLDRFRGERQILANLSHPNVAGLLDGGTTPTGLPYLVMEHVAGDPIDRHCDARRLSVTRRLELFCQVCAAIEFAHRHLVVHRDLKPSNVLVTADGIPKLLDFGIAKLLDPQAMSLPVAETRPMTRLLTPSYASPEQFRGDPVTTSSDVYSLGAVLYELLTGRTPHADAADDPRRLERAVCADEPPRPSVAAFSAGGEGGGAETVARARATTPARLRQQLRGDLEAIVLKALRKEPERRYGSAGQLAADLQLFLEGRPVTAKGESWTYLAGKLLRRHRAAVLAGALLLITSLGLVTFYTARLAAERDRARAAEASAQLEAERAIAVSGFLTGIFEVADPERSPGEAVTARELLDRGSATLEQRLGDQPELLADMLATIGRAYVGLALYERAGEHVRRALELRERSGADPAVVADTLTDLAGVEVMRGRYDEAEAGIRRAQALYRERLGDGDPRVAASLDQLGGLLHTLHRVPEAEASYREALAILEARDPPDRAAIAEVLDGLGTLLMYKGDSAGAAAVLDRALATRRALLPADHPQLLASVNSQAVLLKNLGRLEEAEPLYLEALAGRRRAYEPGHTWIGQSANNYGVFLALVGRHAEAVPLFEEALANSAANSGDDFWATHNARSHLGASLTALGRYEDAEPLLRRAARGLGDTLGREHGRTIGALERLAALYDAWGRPDDASRVRADAERRSPAS